MNNYKNIYVDQGTDFHSSISNLNTNGVVLDNVNFTYYSSFKKVFSSNTAGSFNVTGANTTIEIEMTSNTSSHLLPGKYVYDVLVRDSTGDISKLLEGLVFIIPTSTTTN